MRVKEGDFRKVSGAQPFVETAPLNLVYVGDRSVYEGRNIPEEHQYYLCGQDAAGYAENVNLYTAGHGLRSITRGSVSPELLSVLELDPARYCFALAQQDEERLFRGAPRLFCAADRSLLCYRLAAAQRCSPSSQK